MDFNTVDYKALAEGYVAADTLIAEHPAADTLTARMKETLTGSETHQLGFLARLFEHDTSLGMGSRYPMKTPLSPFGVRAFLNQKPSSDAQYFLEDLPVPFIVRAVAATGFQALGSATEAPIQLRMRLVDALNKSTLFKPKELDLLISALKGHKAVAAVAYPKGENPYEFKTEQFAVALEAALLHRETKPLVDPSAPAKTLSL